MLKEPKSRKTDSLVSFKDDLLSKETQANSLNLPPLDAPDDLIIRHQESFERELSEFELHEH